MWIAKSLIIKLRSSPLHAIKGHPLTGRIERRMKLGSDGLKRRMNSVMVVTGQDMVFKKKMTGTRPFPSSQIFVSILIFTDIVDEINFKVLWKG